MEPPFAYVALGSNIQPEHYLPLARTLLAGRCELVAASSAYRSPAVGRPDAPHFLNAAVALRTSLSPQELKRDVLGPLETELGRVRTTDRNAPRTIDLDLVLYAEFGVFEGEIARHPHLAVPLAEIAPDLRLPGEVRTLAGIAAALSASSSLERVTLPEWDRVRA